MAVCTASVKKAFDRNTSIERAKVPLARFASFRIGPAFPDKCPDQCLPIHSRTMYRFGLIGIFRTVTEHELPFRFVTNQSLNRFYRIRFDFGPGPFVKLSDRLGLLRAPKIHVFPFGQLQLSLDRRQSYRSVPIRIRIRDCSDRPLSLRYHRYLRTKFRVKQP